MDYAQAGTGPQDQHLHLSQHAPQYNTRSPNHRGYTQFRQPSAPAMNGAMDASVSSQTQMNIHASPSHIVSDNSSIGNPHMAHTFYGDIARSSLTPSTPSNAASPRFSGHSPGQQKQYMANYTPSDRSLPSRNISDDTIDDAYAAFILYCNPSFPTTTDVTELKRLFRLPPKSDSKTFSTYTLFELIRKFPKEIKTWAQLALDLGVEPPDLEKGQSTQKVQQYSVRLKRWMRAMHIDAFFEYLVGNQHSYFTWVPTPHEPFPDDGRDGVIFDEDLAIRALDPKLKPKRGRRKNDEGDDENEELQRAPKRPQLDTSFSASSNHAPPQSAYPNSAHPDDMDRFVQPHDPWTTISTITPASSLNPYSARTMTPYSAASTPAQQLRWRLNTPNDAQSPHPMSATTPSTSQAPDSAFDEPLSALTPSSTRSKARRRHGPAVSSAWTSNSTNSTGKLRGRPPSNRSVRDGPFVTFPANPKTKEGPTIDLNRSTPGPTPVEQTPSTASTGNTAPESHHFRFPPTPASALTPASAISINSQQSSLSVGRPERLQLQVPQHLGGPVSLVTPTVLVNGQTNALTAVIAAPSAASPHTSSDIYEQQGVSSQDARQAGPTSHPQPPQYVSHEQPQTQPQTQASAPQSHIVQPRSANSTPILSPFPTLTHESLKRALAHDLLRAEISGRKKLRGTDAKELADALLRKMKTMPQSPTTPSTTNGSNTGEQVHRMALATVLNLSSSLGLPGPPSPVNQKKLVFQRFRVGGDGYDSPIDDDNDNAMETEDVEGANDRKIRESVDVAWTTTIGALVAECKIRGIVMGDKSSRKDDVDRAESAAAAEIDWKSKFEDLKEKLGRKEEEVRELREKVLDAVM
ncbi:hypothetical protein EJ05DRAFT_513284 [Pseudovirgaria hyperparasitica]|uniref:ARS binding protein Abp2 n=1 Tax=Pseudovirgaria hyperparasitica TaxID=470096 RepID=A0A6A6VXJ9_9PEZI|nr:uncharacterized protein EJ05DRAFT_513284 [Pseudovirgaria hyperparasitica]KAF2754953.1 hypothetical protein EJ05DRAFT_513284 [Pseudovirgaria hyperparasitica]